MLRAGYVLQRDTGLTICKLVQLLVLQSCCVVGHFSMIEPAVYMYHIDGTPPGLKAEGVAVSTGVGDAQVIRL